MVWRLRRRGDEEPAVSWPDVLARRWGLWRRLSAPDQTRVVALGRQLVHDLRFETARDLDLTAEMPVLIAAQAALLLNGWDVEPGRRLEPYARVSSVIVHRSTVVVTGERQLDGDVGRLTSDAPAHLSGQAHHRGPVVLSWASVMSDSRHPARRQAVVLHEFAHQLDMLDGVVDGTPPMPDAAFRKRFIRVCTEVYSRLGAGDDAVLRDYGATNPGEFFAVATETFFTDPGALQQYHPALYDVLATYYRQDPATWSAG
jgi:Mlc titration factor MtfA (ptsG expression regulator)